MKNTNFTPFDRFQEVFFDTKTKKATRDLQDAAKIWFEKYYGAIFDYGEGKVPLWKYQAGMLTLGGDGTIQPRIQFSRSFLNLKNKPTLCYLK